MSWTAARDIRDFGATFEERKANPAYREAMENLGRNTGVKAEGDCRPLLYPVGDFRHERWIAGKWVAEYGPMPLTRKAA